MVGQVGLAKLESVHFSWQLFNANDLKEVFKSPEFGFPGWKWRVYVRICKSSSPAESTAGLGVFLSPLWEASQKDLVKDVQFSISLKRERGSQSISTEQVAVFHPVRLKYRGVPRFTPFPVSTDFVAKDGSITLEISIIARDGNVLPAAGSPPLWSASFGRMVNNDAFSDVRFVFPTSATTSLSSYPPYPPYAPSTISTAPNPTYSFSATPTVTPSDPDSATITVLSASTSMPTPTPTVLPSGHSGSRAGDVGDKDLEFCEIDDAMEALDVSRDRGRQPQNHVEIAAHKVILASRSEYFRAMFSNGMRESADQVICVEDEDPESFLRLLRFLYTAELPVDAPPEDLLRIADKFGVDDLKDVANILLVQRLSKSTALEMLQLGDKYHSNLLRVEALQVIVESFSEIVHQSEFVKLATEGSPLLCEICQLIAPRLPKTPPPTAAITADPSFLPGFYFSRK